MYKIVEDAKILNRSCNIDGEFYTFERKGKTKKAMYQKSVVKKNTIDGIELCEIRYLKPGETFSFIGDMSVVYKVTSMPKPFIFLNTSDNCYYCKYILETGDKIII